MKVTTQKEAILLGLKEYWPETPCKHGHIAPRNTNGGWCKECNKRYRNESAAKFRIKNPEEHKKRVLDDRARRVSENGLTYISNTKCKICGSYEKYSSSTSCRNCNNKRRFLPKR